MAKAATAISTDEALALKIGEHRDGDPDDTEIIEGSAVEVEHAEDVDSDELEGQPNLSVVPSRLPRAVALTDGDRELIYTMILGSIPDVTNAEYEFFLRVSELRGLNPLFRESHLIKSSDGRINVMVGIDGFRKLAEQTGQYKGQGQAIFDGEYEGPIPEWKGKPAHCTVTVHREGFEEPMVGESWLEEDGMVTGYADSREGQRANGQWATRTRTMLSKVAEARAIRRAFPRSVAGLYTDDEIAAGNVAANQLEAMGPAPQIPAQAGGSAPGGTSAPGGRWSPPATPDAPEGAIKGVVESLEDLRESRISWRNNEPHHKIELKMKVAGRKHTVIALDDLAVAIDAAALQPAEVVAVEGAEYFEHEWQTGKPKQKQLRGPAAVYVLRRNEWTKIELPPTEGMPLADPPNRGPSSSESPSSPSSSPSESPPPPTDPSTGSSSSRSASSEPPTAPSAPPPDSAASSSGPSEEPPEIPAPEPVFVGGEEGEVVGLEPAVVLKLTVIELRTRAGKQDQYAYLQMVNPQTGELFRGILGPLEEVQAQLYNPNASWRFNPGDLVRIVGTWRRGWIILTAVNAP